jgi:hypothetical protein
MKGRNEMTKNEFNELKVGDKFEYNFKLFEVAQLEDYKISPTEHDLYSLTTTSGDRVKKEDSLVEDMEIVK